MQVHRFYDHKFCGTGAQSVSPKESHISTIWVCVFCLVYFNAAFEICMPLLDIVVLFLFLSNDLFNGEIYFH